MNESTESQCSVSFSSPLSKYQNGFKETSSTLLACTDVISTCMYQCEEMLLCNNSHITLTHCCILNMQQCVSVITGKYLHWPFATC